VAEKRPPRDRLFETRWVHVFEEDTAAGAVFRAEDGDVPLSRRPRERLELDRDGSARLYVAGADDRLVDRPATWTEESGALVVRARDGGAEARIVERSPERLVVRLRLGSRAD
jgi:hypothetical protein